MSRLTRPQEMAAELIVRALRQLENEEGEESALATLEHAMLTWATDAPGPASDDDRPADRLAVIYH